MLRLISSHTRSPLRSLPQTLPSPFKLPINPLHSTASKADEHNRRLLVVQPRLRPETVLKAKLDEALNLANSLEQERDGFFDTELWEKELPPHLIVQNPVGRSRHAATYFGPGTVITIKCHLNVVGQEGGVDAVFVNTILTRIQQRNLEAQLASLMYNRTRLVRVRGPDGRSTFGAIGEAEVVSARG